jgi:transcription elongation factor Elf1
VSCSKSGFVHRSEAIGALRTIKRKGAWRRPVRPTRTYECPRCGKWHLTSLPEGVNRHGQRVY